MRKLMMVLVVLAFAATFAHADEHKGAYVGVGAGYGSTELSVSTSNFEDTFKDNTTAWKVYGGYRFMKFIGLEAAYIDFGKASDTLNLGGPTDVSVKTTGETAELVLTLPLGSYFEIYGKGGYLWYSSKADDGSNSDTKTGNDPVYGAGARILFAKKMGVRLEYEQFDIKDTKKVYLITLGLDWRF